MNLLLWILQGGLALLFLSGGAYKLITSKDLASEVGVLSSGLWRAIGALEVVGAILLILPAATNWLPGLTPIAAAVLAIESLVLAGIYARKSRALTASNPLVWAVSMGLVAAFIAYERFMIGPPT